MKMIKRIIRILFALLILFTMAGHSAMAAEAEVPGPESGLEAEEAQQGPGIKTVQDEAGSLLIEAESKDNYRFEDGRLHIYGGTVKLSTNPEAEYSTERIEVSGYAVLVLNGVRIKADGGSAISVLPCSDTEIRLAAPLREEAPEEEEVEDSEGEIRNYVEGAEGFAGIEVCTLPGSEGMRTVQSRLRISGGGNLTAVGGRGAAAIGASLGQIGCGIIVIEEGNITAIAGAGADAVGCCAESGEEPVYAPEIREQTGSFLALAEKRTIVGAAKPAQDDLLEAEITEEDGIKAESDTEKPETVEEPAEQACLLRGTFAEDEDGILSGLEDIRVRNTTQGTETVFDMPSGYRSFAIKVDPQSQYMIEQGGRVFADAQEESFKGEIEEGEETDILFEGSQDPEAGIVYLAPMSKAPSIDIDVVGEWDDEDDEDGLRPESVTVTLYANGKETGRMLTLSEENDWCGTFDELAVYADSVRQSYSIVEEKVYGYTGLISGSDESGFTITNAHELLPEGRSGEEEIEARRSNPVKEGEVIATVLTKKVSRTTPARTSTTIKKTRSAKTADSNDSIFWGGMLLAAVVALFIWMRFEQSRE